MVVATYAAVAGDYFQDAEISSVNKSAVAITKGDVIGLVVATDDFATAVTASATRRFGVAVQDAAASATKVLACVKGKVCVTADGAIAPHNKVKVSAATAGQVIEAVEASDAFNTIVGTYVGKPAGANERDGLVLTAAADGDIIIVDVGMK